MKINILKFVLPLAITAATSIGHTADRILNCDVVHHPGRAQVEVLNVENHPELVVLKVKLDMQIVNSDKNTQLEGVLVGHVTNDIVNVSGTMLNHPTATTIVTPMDINIRGAINATGVTFLSLYDSSLVLDEGFGTVLNCL